MGLKAGVLSGARISFIDHLLPLCDIMQMPMLCTDRSVYDSADIYYPQIQLMHTPDEIPEHYDALFYVEPARMATGGFNFGDLIYKKEAKGVVGLHGNSDKSRTSYWMERFADEKIVLFYGDYMVDFMKEKGLIERMGQIILTGNYRATYYREHKAFFDKKAAPFLFKERKRKTILYAPTWHFEGKRSEDYSSFFDVYPYVLDHIPDEYQVIVKPHPYLYRIYGEKMEQIQDLYAGEEQILFLGELPLIFPLLDQIDVYLGDYSSIGYDFLTFNRPLFFFNHEIRDLYLHRCGRVVFPYEYKNLYSIIESEHGEDLKEVREKTFHYAFGEEKCLKRLREEIEEALA